MSYEEIKSDLFLSPNFSEETLKELAIKAFKDNEVSAKLDIIIHNQLILKQKLDSLTEIEVIKEEELHGIKYEE